ncbi:MAG: hypothetical protein PF517_03945 [Salinivirgaceae bacterium]|jgi:hypothetical protein|nr:hypothetical protein [Salinivirgaceae bacterium]
MRDTLHKAFGKIGIDLTNVNHPLGHEFQLYEQIEDESIKKNIEFFLMDFAVAMLSIQKNDKSSFDYYLKRITNTTNLNFWGEYFEIILQFKLMDKADHNGLTIRRGIVKKAEPDFVIFNDNAFFHAELSTLKYDKTSNKKNPAKKIVDRILEKNSKSYANANCVLLINITNLLFNEKIGLSIFYKSLKDILTDLKPEIKFNRILLFSTFFSESLQNLNYKYYAIEYKYNLGNTTIDRFFSNNFPLNDIDETKIYFYKQY